MAFQRGKSGNPGGRPVNEIKKLARDNAPLAIQKILAMLASPDERLAFQAAQEILNRAWGKPAQAVIGGDDDDPPIKAVLETVIRPI